MRHDQALRGSAVHARTHRVGRAGGNPAAADESDLRVRGWIPGPRLLPLRGDDRGHGPDDGQRGGGRHDVRRPPGLPRSARARLREVRALRVLLDHARQHHRGQRLGSRAVFGLQRVRRSGGRDHLGVADLLGLAPHHAPPRAGDPRRSGGRRRHRHRRGARAPDGAARAGPALQADLHHRELPESGRAQPVAAPPPGAPRAGQRVRHADPGRRRLRRAALRGRDAAAAVRARSQRRA